MSDKVKFIAHLRCFDTKGGTCYFSKRTICNPSVSSIFNSFVSSTIPLIQSRLPDDTFISLARLSLFDVNYPNSSHAANYEFTLNFC